MLISQTVVAKQQINIKIDLVQGWLNPSKFKLKQSDHKTRYFMIRVSNTLPINISGCQVCLFIKHPSGEQHDTMGTLVNAEQGEFMVELTSGLLKEVGTNYCEIVILKNGEAILSFPHFYFEVEESLHDNVSQEITDEQLGIFWELINQSGEEFKGFLIEKEIEYQQAENTRQVSEQVRITSEQERLAGYAQMQTKVDEVYATTLKYRIVAE